MNTHVMLDIETMSSAKNAMVISIGAVKFDPWGRPETATDAFHVGIDVEALPRMYAERFDISASTFKWWMQDEQDAGRRAWASLTKVDLATALDGFASWYGTDKHLPIWSNGASFDLVILRHAYETLGLECPWSFRSERCFRTLKGMAPDFDTRVVTTDGTKHDALSDAVWQAHVVMVIYDVLDLARPKARA